MGCGISQDSVLDPLRFFLNTSDFEKMIQYQDMSLYSYADDNQVYVYTCSRPGQENILWDKTARCVEEINLWMKSIQIS